MICTDLDVNLLASSEALYAIVVCLLYTQGRKAATGSKEANIRILTCYTGKLGPFAHYDSGFLSKAGFE